MMHRLRQIFKRTPTTIDQSVVGRSEIGWGESKLFQSDFPKYNPDELIGRHGTKIYKKMMIDEQVKAVVRFKRDAITARDWYFEMPDGVEPDEEKIDMSNTMVRETHGSFVDGLNFIMMAVHQGFSMTEKLIDTFQFNGRPYLGIAELIAKPFDTFEFKTDEYGSITRTLQKLDGKEQIIDLDRFVYYVQNPEVDRHYGGSDLREAYRSWYSKDVIIRYYNHFLERFAGGFSVGKPTAGTGFTPGTKEYDMMVAAMNNINVQTSILLPPGIDLENHQPATTDQYEKAIALHDLQIAKALLVPNLLGITPQANSSGGGFAQANTQLEAFLWTLDAEATRLEEAVNEQIFIPLNKLNYADGVGPLFRFKPVSETKKLDIIGKWQELVTAGAVEASDSDEGHIRDLMDFPEKGEPLDLKPEIGIPSSPPEGSNGPRGPVKEPNQERTTNSAAFTRAEKRVAFAVLERKADKIEDDGAVLVEARMADMVADLNARIHEEKWGTPAAGISGINAIDFHPRQKSKVRKAIDSTLTQAWALGMQHSKKELSSAKQEQAKINFGRIDEEASEFLRTAGFIMLGNLSDDMKAIVHKTLVNGIKFSWSLDQITNHLYDSLTAGGFLSMESNQEATGRTLAEITESIGEQTTMHRVRTAVRTNVFDAINEARYSTFTDPSLDGFVEALEYSAILDNRTTAICRHLDGRVYPVDSPVWNKYRPLNHFNCRSILVPVTVIDDDVEGKDAAEGSRFSRPPRMEPQRGFGGNA